MKTFRIRYTNPKYPGKVFITTVQAPDRANAILAFFGAYPGCRYKDVQEIR